MIKKTYTYIRSHPLYMNSLYLMINVGLLSVVGFVFWFMAAKLFSPQQVGIATTLFSSVLMIAGISTLGLSSGLMRFVPRSRTFDMKFNSSIVIVTTTSFLLSIGFVLMIGKMSPSLSFMYGHVGYMLLFIVFTIITTISEIQEGVFLALKKVVFILQKNILSSIARFIFLFLLVSWGGFGIFSSVFLSVILSLALGFVLLYRHTHYIFKPRFDFGEIRHMATYSIGLFVTGQISNMPSYVLPILITSKISAQATAFYFIAASITNVLFLVPKIVSQNLLVEGASDESKIRTHVAHATLIIFALYIPVSIVLIFFGHYILDVFGKSYSLEGFTLMRLFAISGIFVCINYICGTILAMKKNVTLLVTTNIISVVVLLSLSYVFLRFGITGIGYATIVTQLVLLIVNAVLFTRVTSLRI